jgi:hypothetical protein
VHTTVQQQSELVFNQLATSIQLECSRQHANDSISTLLTLVLMPSGIESSTPPAQQHRTG